VAGGDRDYTAALVHLYRGELGRMTSYRVRLDTTTRWAVATSAAIVTFALSQPAISHVVFALALWFDLLFLWLEARRFRAFLILNQRVRLMEVGFFGPMLDGERRQEWKAWMLASLCHPHWTITTWQALSVRLRRVYVWLIGAIYLGWMVKLETQPSVVEAARVGRLPGIAVLAIAAVLLAALVVLSMRFRIREEG
jgi:uncharacterized membrane protein